MSSPYVFSDSEQEQRLLEQTRQLQTRWSTWADNVSPQTVGNLNGLAKNYWWMRPGASVALAEAGHSYNSPVARTASEGAIRVQGKKKNLWDHVYSVLKGVSRTTFAGLSVLYEVPQNIFRATVRARSEVTGKPAELFQDADLIGELKVLPGLLREELGKNTGIMALDDFLAGKRVDLGEGFFPQGKIGEEREKLIRQTKLKGLPDEDAPVTFGRTLALQVTEPDTKPFTMISGLADFGVAIKLDPSARGLKMLSQARQARKLADTPEKIERFLQSDSGIQIVQRIADEKDFATLWRGLGKKVDPKTVRRLQQADTFEDVTGVLRGELGIGIRQFPTLQKLPEVRRSAQGVRLLHMMPKGRLDLDDASEAVETIDRLISNVNTIGHRRINASPWLEQMADAVGDRVASRRVVFDLMGEQGKLLETAGINAKLARRATRLFEDVTEMQRLYAVDEIAQAAHVPGAIVGDELKRVTSAFMWSELLDRFMPLPDVRAIRQLTSRFPNLVSHPAVEVPVAAADFLMSTVWKPLVLLRGAWTVRVVGEEQARMAGAGLDSMIRHPFSAIAWATGRKGGMGVGGKIFKDAAELVDDIDDFSKALSRRTAIWRISGRKISTKNFIPFRRADEGYAHAWGGELIRLRADPVTRQIAEADDLAKVKTWFWEGTGKGFRKDVAKAMGARGEEMLTPAGSDAYIDFLHGIVQKTTGGDARLAQFIRTGKLEDITAVAKRGDYKQVNPKLTKRLQELSDEGIGPNAVVGEQFLTLGAPGAKVGAAYNKATEFMFNFLMTRPTNFLSRSPAFRQFYWNRAEELGAFMDEGARATTIANARKAGLDDVAERLGKITTSGKLKIDEIDTVAKGFALDSTRNLLYDLTERSQFFDVARNIFPFGEAWKEVLTRWARIGTENPVVFRRFQQTIEGARGSGLFFTDESGEERFGYPGSELLTGALTGIPVKFTGRVSALNIAMNVMPGVGPLVSIPTGSLLPDTPDWDTLREFVLPFGAPRTEGGILESQLPAWFQKVRQAFGGGQDERIWNNSVFDVARYLVATGKHTTNSPEEVDRLMVEARDRARSLWLVRGAVQFVGPAAPQFEFLVKDRENKFMTYQTLIQDFHEMQQADYESAPEKFMTKYGEQFFLFMQGKSRALMPGVPTSKEGLNWARANPELVKKYSNTWGLFAPEGEGFDYDAYLGQFEGGARQALTPEQAVRMGNHRVATMVYGAAKERVGDKPNFAQSEWLRSLKSALKDDYPGFQDFSGMVEKAKIEDLIKELGRASQDKTLSKTEIGQGLQLYFQARDKALSAAKGMGLASFQSAKRAQTLRAWLNSVASSLREEYPGFGDVWEEVLSREVPTEE